MKAIQNNYLITETSNLLGKRSSFNDGFNFLLMLKKQTPQNEDPQLKTRLYEYTLSELKNFL